MNNTALQGELILRRRTKLRRRMLHNCNIKLNNLNSRFITLETEIHKYFALYSKWGDPSYLETAQKLLNELSEIKAKTETYQNLIIELREIELRRLPVSIVSPFVSVKLSTLRLILKSKAKTKLRRFITEIILSITEPFKIVDIATINC